MTLITVSITTMIAGNIALSLGMVVALSNLRFRNPVKSPFELAVFFLLKTMGITAGADFNVLLVLIRVTILIPFAFEAVETIYLKNAGKIHSPDIVFGRSRIAHCRNRKLRKTRRFSEAG